MHKQQRNQAIECCRLLAAIGVVFIHVCFPARLGSLVNCLARLSVPFFFAVSGYFSSGADTSSLRKKGISILKFYIGAVILTLSWGIIREAVVLGAFPMDWLLGKLKIGHLIRLLFLQVDFLGGGHLWYLSSMQVCYLLLEWYVRKKGSNYRCLYRFGCLLLVTYVVVESVVKAASLDVPNYYYRNALLFGIPMFTLGLFLGQNQHKLRTLSVFSQRNLLFLFFLGVVMSTVQWAALGELEMPLGVVLQIFALMLLVTDAPCLVKADSRMGKMISCFGSVSFVVYVTHLIWADIYIFFYSGLFFRLGGMEPYLRPILVAALSLGTGVIWILAKTAARKLPRKKKEISQA